ncbi:HNH endonuclease [Haloarcula nitratireducens]|uniref:HNH endonuclease n=1 Tax=Haloarcula nitratireducens TaxID=2487749 RepID=A0AAW4PFP0_9EURY|nr:HNH endonuclease [Halomicroarcula nitratireducens]MBX0296678.1 HNH endonuclease [Halomicroarcula nitratireducens]
MSHWTQEAQKYGPKWDRIASDVRKRDDWTCQRCGIKSGPHADDDGRVLDVHHIVWKSRGGSDNKQNLVTLCRPCHGVQHPENENFDRHRHRAALYPEDDANEQVAFINSAKESETIDAYLSRQSSRKCQRCRKLADDRNALLLYPNFTASDLDGDAPGEKCAALCEPCAGLVHSDDAETIDDDLRTMGNAPAPHDLTDRIDEAAISGYSSTRKLDATREPVNYKEWFLFKSPYRYVHAIWRNLGTVALFIAFAFVTTRDLERLAVWMNVMVPLPAPGWDAYDMGVLMLLGAGIGAYTVRWGIAALTQQLWQRFDPKMEPHHFEQTVWSHYRVKTGFLIRYVALPYAALVFVAIALTVFL